MCYDSNTQFNKCACNRQIFHVSGYNTAILVDNFIKTKMLSKFTVAKVVLNYCVKVCSLAKQHNVVGNT